MAVKCTEEDDEYPPHIVVPDNYDPYTAEVGCTHGQESSKPLVYISHADNPETLEYVKQLQDDVLMKYLGYRQCDILTLENNSIVGQTITKSIMTLVQRSKKMIVVISKEYTRSHWNAYEMATMLQKGDITNADIIPIICDDGSTVEDLPDELSILIPLHATDRNFIRRLGQSLDYNVNQ